jgi:hypothetical protein
MSKRIDRTWIYFELGVTEPDRKTQIWHIHNKRTNEWLGDISWFPNWRKYSFRSVAHHDRKHDNGLSDIWFEDVCLMEIAEFCRRLNIERDDAILNAKFFGAKP